MLRAPLSQFTTVVICLSSHNAMSESTLLTYALTIIGALILALSSLVAWAATQMRHDVKNEMSKLSREVAGINLTLRNIETDLRGKLADLDRRVSVVEATCRMNGCARDI